MKILPMLLIVVILPVAWAIDLSKYKAPGVDFFRSPGHIASFCIPCHQRFAERSIHAVGLPIHVKDPSVLATVPCSKSRCHGSAPGGKYGDRWRVHMGICADCHPTDGGKFDVHSIHINFTQLLPPWKVDYPVPNISIRRAGVSCKLCHASPGGYNSTMVEVPPLNISASLAPGAIIKPAWENKCSFCHPSARNAKRLHDVHEPVIIVACPICHTSKIFERTDLVARVGRKMAVEQGLIEPTGELDFVRENLFEAEMRSYFNGIVEELIRILLVIRGTRV
jgi:hypothetical protein